MEEEVATVRGGSKAEAEGMQAGRRQQRMCAGESAAERAVR